MIFTTSIKAVSQITSSYSTLTWTIQNLLSIVCSFIRTPTQGISKWSATFRIHILKSNTLSLVTPYLDCYHRLAYFSIFSHIQVLHCRCSNLQITKFLIISQTISQNANLCWIQNLKYMKMSFIYMLWWRVPALLVHLAIIIIIAFLS